MPDNSVFSVQIVFQERYAVSYEPFFTVDGNSGMYTTPIIANRCSSVYHFAVADNYCKAFVD